MDAAALNRRRVGIAYRVFLLRAHMHSLRCRAFILERRNQETGR